MVTLLQNSPLGKQQVVEMLHHSSCGAHPSPVHVKRLHLNLQV